jgi:hypothetical protein
MKDIEDALNALDAMEFDTTPESHSVWFTKTGYREGKLTVARKRPKGFHPSLTVRLMRHPERETWTQDQRQAVALRWARANGMQA